MAEECPLLSESGKFDKYLSSQNISMEIYEDMNNWKLTPSNFSFLELVELNKAVERLRTNYFYYWDHLSLVEERLLVCNNLKGYPFYNYYEKNGLEIKGIGHLNDLTTESRYCDYYNLNWSFRYFCYKPRELDLKFEYQKRMRKKIIKAFKKYFKK